MASILAPGYGKTSQDWSYLTPKRGLYVQTAAISTPDGVPDLAIIDTTATRAGSPGSHGRDQTLVIYVTLIGSSTLSNAVLYLWVDSSIDEVICEAPDVDCPPYPAPGDIGDVNKWALIETGYHGSAPSDSSLAFSFTWFPAGRYKAAIGSADTFTGSVLISEQHTE